MGPIGVDKCLKRARDISFWPKTREHYKGDTGMRSMPREEKCIAYHKESLISLDVSDYSWKTIATDLFTWNTLEYLVVHVVDYFSR